MSVRICVVILERSLKSPRKGRRKSLNYKVCPAYQDHPVANVVKTNLNSAVHILALNPFHTYARMLRIEADVLSAAIRDGSVLYVYCIRTMFADVRPDPPSSAAQF